MDEVRINPRDIRWVSDLAPIQNTLRRSHNPEMDSVNLDALKPENVVVLKLPGCRGSSLWTAFHGAVSTDSEQVIPDIRFLYWMNKLSASEAREFGFAPELLYFTFGSMGYSPGSPRFWSVPKIELVGSHWKDGGVIFAMQEFASSYPTETDAIWDLYHRAIVLEL